MSQSCLKKDFISVFYSGGSKPLNDWRASALQTGHGKIITDQQIRGFVLELISTNVSTAFIETPKHPEESLNIDWPFVTLQLKNLKRFFAFEIQILDDQGIRRRLNFANYQSRSKVSMFCTQMPLFLAPGWNQIQLNLAEYIRRAYRTNYIQTVGIRIHANTRLRRIFFTQKLFPDEIKPSCFRLKIFTPMTTLRERLRNSTDDKPQRQLPASPKSTTSANSR
ncbi:cilia- and flagella-associated protein 20-like [Phlebotomus argentipes]|uniref:cilia- and flagella-associated protein 20-like n=1 Tax=Phlebotomus argentipes TaxID=94469 RepID=UPI002892F1B4|nr:cilia- and flagella-associated protein 20-like [Phlebotomus argentipes]